ncbi:hypothetical protein BKA57DRAFT_217547 [Linnemannia elongata]|nr:hypothetical protein BKA57DRAFT_217547 [Linnemannia elongata]
MLRNNIENCFPALLHTFVVPFFSLPCLALLWANNNGLRWGFHMLIGVWRYTKKHNPQTEQSSKKKEPPSTTSFNTTLEDGPSAMWSYGPLAPLPLFFFFPLEMHIRVRNKHRIRLNWIVYVLFFRLALVFGSGICLIHFIRSRTWRKGMTILEK